jgi:hypothetical protein
MSFSGAAGIAGEIPAALSEGHPRGWPLVFVDASSAMVLRSGGAIRSGIISLSRRLAFTRQLF